MSGEIGKRLPARICSHNYNTSGIWCFGLSNDGHLNNVITRLLCNLILPFSAEDFPTLSKLIFQIQNRFEPEPEPEYLV